MGKRSLKALVESSRAKPINESDLSERYTIIDTSVPREAVSEIFGDLDAEIPYYFRRLAGVGNSEYWVMSPYEITEEMVSAAESDMRGEEPLEESEEKVFQHIGGRTGDVEMVEFAGSIGFGYDESLKYYFSTAQRAAKYLVDQGYRVIGEDNGEDIAELYLSQ